MERATFKKQHKNKTGKQGMNKFKLSLLTLAMAGVSSLALSAEQQSAEPAPDTIQQQATQQAAVEDVEVIQVRGFASSLFRSLDAKRFGDTVSETISADDLGALPDVSMADALTRLPGISAVRTGGQAAEINIRGMSGGFVFSTLNGREQVSTSGKRNIEFDQYPSELINSAAVYKSPKASLIEGGVAGTVELQTASPLRNEKQHTFTVNARGMYNDRADEVPDGVDFGHRFSLSYQGKFADDTRGLALCYARLYKPSVATQFVGLAYNGQKDTNDDGVNEFISEGFEIQHKGGEEARDGRSVRLLVQAFIALHVAAARTAHHGHATLAAGLGVADGTRLIARRVGIGIEGCEAGAPALRPLLPGQSHATVLISQHLGATLAVFPAQQLLDRFVLGGILIAIRQAA